MARKPNYRFEKIERERKKAAKKAEKAERANPKVVADSETERTPSTWPNEGGGEAQELTKPDEQGG